MGHPLWQTVYRESSASNAQKGPRKWDPNSPFDPDSDAFFENAPYEAFIDIQRPAENQGADTSASRSDRFSQIAAHAAERRQRLMDSLARRRREVTAELENLERAVRMMDRSNSDRTETRDEQTRLPAPHATRPRQSSSEASSSSSASSLLQRYTISSDRPLSPLSERELRELQTEPDSDDDEPGPLGYPSRETLSTFSSLYSSIPSTTLAERALRARALLLHVQAEWAGQTQELESSLSGTGSSEGATSRVDEASSSDAARTGQNSEREMLIRERQQRIIESLRRMRAARDRAIGSSDTRRQSGGSRSGTGESSARQRAEEHLRAARLDRGSRISVALEAYERSLARERDRETETVALRSQA